jgi:hypothetical protein
MSAKSEICPFKAGDHVVYRPSERGHNMDMPEGRLVPGKTYVVQEIQQERYVVVEGYRHPGGGIYWTEFAAAV